MTDLDRLKTLRDNATQGEWGYLIDRREDGRRTYRIGSHGTNEDVAEVSFEYGRESDAELIVATVNELPDLIARCRELEAREAKVRELAEDLQARADAIAEASPEHVIHIEQARQHAAMIRAILDGGGA